MAEDRISPDVEAYLANVPEPARGMLERIRAVVRRLAPDAEEVIAYGIPTFRLNGNLVHYAAFSNHCSFFPGAAAASDAFGQELAGFKTSKGTIRFTSDNPLPDDLVERITIARIEQNRAKSARQALKRTPE